MYILPNVLTLEMDIHTYRNMGVTGKAVTPYVLQRVNELTGGKSLQASILKTKHQ